VPDEPAPAPAPRRPSLFSFTTEHAVPRFRTAPAERGVNVLLLLPKGRIDRLLADMDGRLIARLLLAADPDRRAALLGHLGAERLSAELTLLPMVEAAAVLAALPPEWARGQLDRLSAEQLGPLLTTLTSAEQTALTALLEPQRLAELRRTAYEGAVMESLRRTNAGLQWVADGHLLVTVFQRLFGVAMCHVELGPLPAATAERARQVFTGHPVDGLLLITNAASATAPLHSGVPAQAVVWSTGDNDGVLGRALVALAGA
jgi:hypothetical protein